MPVFHVYLRRLRISPLHTQPGRAGFANGGRVGQRLWAREPLKGQAEAGLPWWMSGGRGAGRLM